MNRRGLIPIIILNIIISVAVGFGVLTLFGNRGGGATNLEGTPMEQGVSRLVTFVVVHTATQDPNATPMVVYQIITATPEGSGEIANVPVQARDDTQVALPPAPTIDPTFVTTQGNISVDAPLPEGCVRHTLVEGEFPSSLAVTYGVSFLEIMAVNNMTEDDARLLRIGTVLIIPLEGCPRDTFITALPTSLTTEDLTLAAQATLTATFAPTSDVPPTITVTPTLTLAPTASNSQLQVEIVEVTGVGDITREQVVIRNNGNLADISGWTLSDGQGNIFTFPNDRRLFSGAGVTINTRAGSNTPVLFFWGRDLPAFESGDVVVLKNREGEVVASLRLP
ncbi:MAG: lamin tail domain-containing protein [Phototrophicales bacterium]|nr:lamin tail domain-containing protein [Phototrophicales bacterium]